jgi:hypothetical protein
MKGKTYKKRHPRLKKRSTKKRSNLKRSTNQKRSTKQKRSYKPKWSTLKMSGGARHNTVAVGDLPPTPRIQPPPPTQPYYEGPGYDREIQERDSKKAENRFNMDNAGSLKLMEEYRRKQKEAEDARNKIKVTVGEAPHVPITSVNKKPFYVSDIPDEDVMSIGGGPRLRSFTRKLKKCFGMSCMNTSTVAPAEEEMITPSSSPKSRKPSGSNVAPKDIVNAALKEAKSVKTQQRKALAEFAERNADVERIGSRLERRDSPRTKAALETELAALGTASTPRSRSTRRVVPIGTPIQNSHKMSLVELAKLNKILIKIRALDNSGILAYAKNIEGMKGKTFSEDIKQKINMLINTIENENLGSANKVPLYKSLKSLIITAIQRNI